MPDHVRGMEFVVGNLNGTEKNLKQQILKNITKATKLLYETIQDNGGKEDIHTPNWLKSHGYPYATRKPHNPHTKKPYIVHKQEGTLMQATHSDVQQTDNRIVGYVWIDEGACPYAFYVITGTKKMIGRDFLQGSLDEKEEKIFEIIQKGIRQGLITRAE